MDGLFENQWIGIALWVIPYTIMIGCIIQTVIRYLKLKGVNPSTVMTIVNSLTKDEYLKNVIDTGISIVATTAEGEQPSETVRAVKRYVNTYLYETLQLCNSIITTSPEDDEVYRTLKENYVKVDDITSITNGLLTAMGYDDATIKNLIADKLKSYKEDEDNKK